MKLLNIKRIKKEASTDMLTSVLTSFIIFIKRLYTIQNGILYFRNIIVD